ncbi:MAG: YraN family protein [Oscillospiraceae bacterium]|nr:YraN family protein [Oscillospiraceae bacterium]
MDVRQRGKWGEAAALDFLLKKNYTAVTAGYRSRFGEIDLIVKNSQFLVFVEVKLRKNANFAHAREFVGKTKQNKLRMTAEMWLSENETELQPRFDVIEIYAPSEQTPPEIIHIENAF